MQQHPASALLAGLATVAAGFGYAWTAIASKLLTDELAAGALLVAVVWLASAAASEGLALLSEMSALQRRPATRVAPTMFAVQIVVPVLLAPLIFGEKWGDTPLGGAALLAFVAVAIAGTVAARRLEDRRSGDRERQSGVSGSQRKFR